MPVSCITCSDDFSDHRAMSIHHKLAHGESIAIEEDDCVECGERFEYYPSDKPGKYCKKCVENDDVRWGKLAVEKLSNYWGRSGKDNPNWDGGKFVPCDQCGMEIYRNPWYLENQDNQFCSQDCQARFDRVEEGHIRKGRGAVWREAREKVLKRDDYECQTCGSNGSEYKKSLHVHHIIPSRHFNSEKEAHDLDNLITLCPSCHPSVEHGTKTLK